MLPNGLELCGTSEPDISGVELFECFHIIGRACEVIIYGSGFCL